MADEQDLEDLKRGDVDMARRDFRNTELSGLDLSNRDFSGAHLERAIATGANFTNAKLTGAHTLGLNAQGGDFSRATAIGSVFHSVDFRNASFRGANFSRSHFSKTNLAGANLVGADFTKAVFNDGTTLEGCEVDETTRFDGARIFRPLARQPAFRFYHVDRGVLVRNPMTTDADKPHQATPEPVPAPHFEDEQGSFEVDFRAHNGRVFLGSGDWLFETKWTSAGSRSVHAYNDPPSIKGIAVARGVSSIEEVTAEAFSTADFSSRTRTPKVGEVLLLENTQGRAAAVEILDIRITPESQSGTLLKARYRILLDASRDFSGGAQPASVNQLKVAVEAALAALDGVVAYPNTEGQASLIGHNNPPPEAALSEEDYQSVRATLIELGSIERKIPENSFLEKAKIDLTAINQSIMDWSGRKFAQVQEGFFTQLGTSLADPKNLLGAYLVLSGKLDVVIAAIVTMVAG
ncbi:pentapeptide repeat-containing protein [Caulobacter sp. NIBR2454]|uniref:pentapeptide repeat-containing protein n=1 Tax=Caulobacter sp. NIBR2454 TaxID=3015996 RepID=UPI0022B65EAA|nr:pentapeptide repeat-containing protein [Caulobacter sp. NIBR2454]